MADALSKYIHRDCLFLSIFLGLQLLFDFINEDKKLRSTAITRANSACIPMGDYVGIQVRWCQCGPLLALSTFMQAVHNNALLAVPTLLYVINNYYLKIIMQIHMLLFRPNAWLLVN